MVIVKKHYPNRRKVQTRRKWKLQQLAKVQEGGITKKDEEREANEYEMFMRDLEEDPELRAAVNIYRGVCVHACVCVLGLLWCRPDTSAGLLHLSCFASHRIVHLPLCFDFGFRPPRGLSTLPASRAMSCVAPRNFGSPLSHTLLTLYHSHSPADENVPVDAPVPQMTEDGEYVEEDFPEVELQEMLQALRIDDHDPNLATQHVQVQQQQNQMSVHDMIGDINNQMEH